MVICLERGADLHMAQLMPLPVTISCFSKFQIGFTFLVPVHLGNQGPLNGCVCVCMLRVRSCSPLLPMFCRQCVCVCLLVTTVSPAKVAELIEMLHALWTWVAQGTMYYVVAPFPPAEGAICWVFRAIEVY